MNKKDKKLQELFSNFATDEKPNIQVTNRAKELMNNQKASHGVQKQRYSFAKITAVCATILIIFISGLSFFINFVGKDNNNGNPNNGNNGIEQKIINVSASEIIIKHAKQEELSTVLAHITAQDNINNIQIYKYNLKNNKDVLLKDSTALYRVDYVTWADDGYAYVTIFAELSQVAYQKLNKYKDIRTTLIISNIEVRTKDSYDDGEYYINAYIEESTVKYSISIQSNLSTTATKVLENIAQNLEKNKNINN